MCVKWWNRECWRPHREAQAWVGSSPSIPSCDGVCLQHKRVLTHPRCCKLVHETHNATPTKVQLQATAQPQNKGMGGHAAVTSHHRCGDCSHHFITRTAASISKANQGNTGHGTDLRQGTLNMRPTAGMPKTQPTCSPQNQHHCQWHLNQTPGIHTSRHSKPPDTRKLPEGKTGSLCNTLTTAAAQNRVLCQQQHTSSLHR